MKKFIAFTFLMLGWAFYEMSGGADFQPETRDGGGLIASAEASEAPAEPQAEVTRADTASLVSIAMPMIASGETEAEAEVIEASASADDLADAAATAPRTRSVTEEVTLASADVAAPAPEAPEAVADPSLDLRQVAGDWVNMRSGPGTDYGVVETLPQGTQAEVMEVDASGWARIRITDSGLEGWMAERLLTNG